jgi:Domain of unknown function (DUF305)
MTLVSCAFVRKRVISLATTASVTATSFALAQDPPRTHHLAGAMRGPTEDVARDFVEMKVPRHQAAVDMAKTELKYALEKRARQLAQEIVANQQHEMTVMRYAVSDKRSFEAQPPPQPRMELSPQSTEPHGAVAHGGVNMSR